MNNGRYLAPVILLVCVLLSVVTVDGQDADIEHAEDVEQPTGIEATDLRIVSLQKRYREDVNELSEQLIAEIEMLGTVDSPPHLAFVQENKGKWSFRGSIRGFANHSISINARDIEATPSWNDLIDAPPLACREALAVADGAMREWFSIEDSQFLLQRLSLVPLLPSAGKWYWEAEYEVSKGGLRKDLTVAIRMDGKVLTKFKSEK